MGESLAFEVKHLHLALDLRMRMVVPFVGQGFNVGGSKLNSNHGSGTFFELD